MHANAALLTRLFDALDRHDAQTMASCYHPDATFHDIAFDLRGADEIRGMWQMICAGDIRATFEVVQADDREGHVRLVDVYTFGSAASSGPAAVRRPVRNVVDSRFRFERGLIIAQHDSCDARAWAAAALGGIRGFLAGRIRLLRSTAARAKLRAFVQAQRAH